MDNMNGLTAGMSSVLVLALFWLGLVPASSALVLTGALIGFLVLNYPWGRIFLGDQGSQFLGFWLSALALHGLVAKYDVSPDLSTALYCISFLGIAFLPFIFDTILVIVIRLRAGRPITVGDRNHLSHQLLRSGVSVNLVPVTLVSVQALCGFICYWLAKYWLGSV
jgi:UDP-N-acetylmuramyl pentapeptide phosphotransferase/UDP-N-acetylglucosamine-1-phosphate transferase